MKYLVLNILLFLISFIDNLNAQIEPVWIKRFNGPLNSVDNGKIVKADNNGSVYVAGTVSKNANYIINNAVLIKYNSGGDTSWLRYYDSPSSLGSFINDMDSDGDGNIIITGSTSIPGNEDFLTVKYDPNGNELWAKTIEQGDDEQAQALAIDENGNIFVTGVASKIFQSWNILTAKYSSDGNLIWNYEWVGPEGFDDIPIDLAIDKNGDLIVAGRTSTYVGTTDYVTIKMNTYGDTLWVRKYDSPEHAFDYLKAVGVDDFGNVYVTGNIYSVGGNHDIITIKYNSAGDTLWTKRYQGPGTGDDIVNAMIVDSVGNFYLAGSSFVLGNGMDCLLMKYNSSGDLIWVKTYGEYYNYDDAILSMTMDNAGNIYLTGSTKISSTNIAYITMKYDNDGNQKWKKIYDGPVSNFGVDISNSVCVDNSGYVYVTGSSQGILTDYDILTIKYNQSANEVREESQNLPIEFKLYPNFPNPFNLSTMISYQLPMGCDVTLSVYDILGNEIATLVDEYKPAGRYEVEFSVAQVSEPELASGVYFYQLKVADPEINLSADRQDSGQGFIQTKKMILLR